MGDAGQTVSLSLFGFGGPMGRAWALAQMLMGRRPLARLPGLSFYKMCGTGTGEGFTPIPNTAVYTILGVWETRSHAEAALHEAEVFGRYARHASMTCTLLMQATSARGRWSRQAPFTVTRPRLDGPIAALTRATLRPRALPQFWGQVGPISERIGANQDVVFKIGMGEVPWMQQITFSIWPDSESMARFARADGPHAEAIRAVREGAWFSEELYARFEILGRMGEWPGLSSLPFADAR
ncbi:MAG: spheroidene monooxygenase [Pseudomonadota bacterium]